MSNCNPCRASRILNLASPIAPEYGSISTGMLVPATFYGFTAMPIDLSTRDVGSDVATPGVLANVGSDLISLTSAGVWRITGNFIFEYIGSSVLPTIGIRVQAIGIGYILNHLHDGLNPNEIASIDFNFMFNNINPTEDLRFEIGPMGGTDQVLLNHYDITVERIE